MCSGRTPFCRADRHSSLWGCSPSLKKNVDAADDLLRVVRFFQRTPVTEVPCLLGSPGYSGGQDHIDVRVLLANPLGKTEPVYAAAQLNLGKDNVDLLSGLQHG
jgi:hypothetical protein